MLPTITPDIVDIPPGTRVQFPATFQDYEDLLERLGDRAAVRVRYRDDHICLTAPLPEHGNQTDILSDLVKALLKKMEKNWQGFNVVTLRKTGVPGVEPDACFYVDNVASILGKRPINLNQDPPPDLAIETDLTPITDIQDYVPFAVPEVWIYKAGVLNIYLFTSGEYRQAESSQLFSTYPVKARLPAYVKQAWQESSSVALRRFEASL